MANENDIGLRIENALLKSQKEISEHVTKEIGGLRDETQGCLKDLPCKDHDEGIKKNTNNLKLLVIVLVSTGVLGGSLWSALKLLFGGF